MSLQMDYKFIFVILFIGHLLGDFYFQSQLMVNKKDDDWKIMLCHGLIYMAAIVLPFLLLFTASLTEFYVILLAPILHLIVDISKGWLNRNTLFEKRQGLIFALDQAIHIIIILSVAYYYAIHTSVAYSWFGIQLGEIYATLNLKLSLHQFIRFVCLFLFIGKPVNIIVSKILDSVKEENVSDTNMEKTDSNTDPKAGWVIGILERYLTVILILFDQYTAVGFAFTAKSVTRFDKISKDKVFAEQYLIGTMSSLLFAVIGAIMCM